MSKRIAFQGELGAYSHEACLTARPDATPVPCASFEEAIAAVKGGDADFAMLPVENTTYGRVADNHRLIPDCGLFIVDEAFVRVRIALMANAGVPLSDVRLVRAHPVLLPQSAAFLRAQNIKPVSAADSAGAAAELAASGAQNEGVLASELAAEIHGLTVLASDIEDHGHNTTRFVIMGREADYTRRADKMVTAFMFRVRNLPAALYKAMGGFATNGLNLIKIESYLDNATLKSSQFHIDIAEHVESQAMQQAIEELKFYASEYRWLGTFESHPFRVK
ncbi:prephenate dehydratase [uncultured Lentibacter sp.]|uniref:prephenate dehydratase n=1 Tax=uncultured Lentibacter sp. TaxID=1659309 RepID=UPI00262FC3AD|nr:prephenate dehydratase [uncultured Lentibacter sp.]